MKAEELAALALDLARRFAGREVERVQPVDRSGVHVAFAGLRSGLRLDAALPGGIALPFDDGPPRLKGGRGAWPDLAAAADAALTGLHVERFRVAPASGAISMECEGCTLALVGDAGRNAGLVLVSPGAPPRVMPPLGRDEQKRLLAALDALEDPEELARALPAPDAVENIGDALAETYLDARREVLEGRRLEDARALLKAETRRVRRALDAVARDEARARDPAEIRAHAEALLAAGPALRETGDAFVVPDPRAPGRTLEVRREPPDAAPYQVADRLFARARKETRSVSGRAERRAFLQERLAGLERAGAAQGVEALEEALRELGLGAGLEAGPPTGSAAGKRKGRAGASSIRVFRSPHGFEVLAGRNARQNERLTFKVASPDDFWMHVEDMPGSHVVIRRRDGVDPGEEDLRFAAGIAAALSQAPEGIQVDVHVARRKHVRKPRGAPPGLVTLRKAKTIRVRVGRAPQE